MSKVFISHSSRDKDRMADFRALLEAEEVPYWVDDQGILIGDDAPKELRTAIQECSCCVFFATRNSLESEWCLIETAAFWGAGKDVLPYLAEPDVSREMLPEHLKNARPSSNSQAVRRRAGEIVRAAQGKDEQVQISAAEVPIDLVEDAIRRAIGIVHVQRSLFERLLLVRALVTISADDSPSKSALHDILPAHMHGLRGFSRREMDEACRVQWPIRFRFEDLDGATVEGYSARIERELSSVMLQQCLVLFYWNDYCDGTAIVGRIEISASGAGSLDDAINFGKAHLGHAVQVVEVGGVPVGLAGSDPARSQDG